MHSRELIAGIHSLNRQNLNTSTPYTALCSKLILSDKHKQDSQIQTLLTQINQKFALSSEDQQKYQHKPLAYMGEGAIIGIHNHHGGTYLIIRAEHYREYTMLCKGLEQLKLKLYLIKDQYIDATFS